MLCKSRDSGVISGSEMKVSVNAPVPQGPSAVSAAVTTACVDAESSSFYPHEKVNISSLLVLPYL